jgi:BirA family biotin operon repressor/biotin-[acetyl-CoA-carboxylase] ligase
MLPVPEWYEVLPSTNSYLLQRLEQDPMLPNGTAVGTRYQTAGRGQRSKQWVAAPDSSLLFSVAAQPAASLADQPLFCFGVAITIAETLETLFPESDIQLKWPNDLYTQDRKLGGILIENVLRGSRWQWTVIGLGLNLLPQAFDPSMHPIPISIAERTGQIVTPQPLAHTFQAALTAFVTRPLSTDILHRYNQRLYRRGQFQTFETAGVRWQGSILEALPDGQLRVWTDGQERTCIHGTDLWIPEMNASGTTSAA